VAFPHFCPCFLVQAAHLFMGLLLILQPPPSKGTDPCLGCAGSCDFLGLLPLDLLFSVRDTWI
jgi:hypothetical protein